MRVTLFILQRKLDPWAKGVLWNRLRKEGNDVGAEVTAYCRERIPVPVNKVRTPSPSGMFNVVARINDSTYYHDGKVAHPVSANPLATAR